MVREMGIEKVEGHEFQFTRNWFLNRNLPTFRKWVHPEWAGNPCTYLELGVFEGMSMVWMLQHVLTHSDCWAVGVDPWLMTRKLDEDVMEEVMTRACHNTKPWIYIGYDDGTDFKANPDGCACQLIRGNSAEVLRRMTGKRGCAGITKESVDLCMIDGNHNGPAVLDDARQCLKLMKKGGWLLFDDVENDKKKEHHVLEGLDWFKKESGDKIRFLWKHRYMEAYEVVK
jgi:hypothetical protein